MLRRFESVTSLVLPLAMILGLDAVRTGAGGAELTESILVAPPVESSATAGYWWDDPETESAPAEDDTPSSSSGCHVTCCDDTWCAGGCSATRWWFAADYLLLWTQGNAVPPLVTTNATVPPRSEAGILGVGDTEIALGGRLDQGGRSGVALSGGYWLDDCHRWGLQGTWWYVGNPSDQVNDTWASTGVPVVARPFFNIGTGLEDAQLVAYPNVVDGAISVATSSDLRSAEALLSWNWLCDCWGRVDLLGGYRYLRFREGLYIEENLVARQGSGLIPVGTTIDLFDQFNVSNSFHGGVVGVATNLQRGCFQLDIATKLAIGNVQRRLLVDGGTVVTTPGGGQAVSTGGFLALPSNIGRYEDDAFGLLPELNLKGSVCVTDHLSVSLGYQLLFLTDVLRAGQQIDRVVDTGQLSPGMQVNGAAPNGSVNPMVSLDSTTLWVQGLTVGCELCY